MVLEVECRREGLEGWLAGGSLPRAASSWQRGLVFVISDNHIPG